jgi:sec-independent protein translocase protein TatC
MTDIQTKPSPEPPAELPPPSAMGSVTAGRETGNVHTHKKILRQVDPEERLPFTEHLEELRWRIIYSLAAVLIVFIPMFAVSDQVLAIVRRPLPSVYKLYFFNPTAALFIYLKIAFYASLVVSMPMIIYQAWEFVAPGLLQMERKYTKYFVLAGTFFFALGAAFCYFLVLPPAMTFLVGYGGDSLTPLFNTQDYISFFFMMILAFGASFELPMILMFLMGAGIVSYKALAKKRGYALISAFVVGAVLTPTVDPFGQTMLAVPLYIFFEMSLLAARIFFPGKNAPPDEPTQG